MEEQIVAWLREHAEKHNLETRALSACRAALQPDEGDEVILYSCGERGSAIGKHKLFPLEELEIKFVRHSLRFQDSLASWPHIITKVVFGRRSDRCYDAVDGAVEYIEPFGYGFLMTDLVDGSDALDWIELEPWVIAADQNEEG